MVLKKQQIAQLIQIVSTVTDDDLDCDKCFDQISEFVEIELAGRSVPEALAAVDNHLRNCICCRHEYEILKAALVDC